SQKSTADKDLVAAKAELAKLECKDAPADSGAPQCKPGTASAISSARGRVNSAETDLKKATTASAKSSAQKKVDTVQAELAQLECKDAPADGGQCKPGDAQSIKLATSKVGTAQRKVDGLAKDKKATTAQKTAAEKDLQTAKADLATLECKDAPADAPGGQCKPA